MLRESFSDTEKRRPPRLISERRKIQYTIWLVEAQLLTSSSMFFVLLLAYHLDVTPNWPQNAILKIVNPSRCLHIAVPFNYLHKASVSVGSRRLTFSDLLAAAAMLHS